MAEALVGQSSPTLGPVAVSKFCANFCSRNQQYLRIVMLQNYDVSNWSRSHFEAFLRENNLLMSSLHSVTSAGEGLMNNVLRLTFKDKTSLILKQSPPYCHKFPHIPAPKERTKSEKTYYELVNKNKILSGYSPQVLLYDESKNLMIMSDLGRGNDFEELYRQRQLTTKEYHALLHYLQNLHCITPEDKEFTNSSMKELNDNYIFRLPFNCDQDEVDLDSLTPGLKNYAHKVYRDQRLIQRIHFLGDQYRNQQNSLIHGDYYPRSWISVGDKISVIDPEFSFFGMAEFDLGVFLAHLYMSGDGERCLNEIRNEYKLQVDENIILAFAGVEILRRLLYVSQLPVKNTLNFKKVLIDKACEFIYRL
jgi:5-methylthioribose kinase